MIPPRGFCRSETCTSPGSSSSAAATSLRICTASASQNAPWSRNRAANRAVLGGAVAAYRRAGLRVGFYSTPALWRDIVGPVRYGFPEWRTAGLSTRKAALARCRRGSFQGGRAVITQWYTSRVDFDLLCPGRPADEVLATYFTRV